MKHITFLLLFSLINFKGFSQCLNSENAFKAYFDKSLNNLDPIEGQWSVNVITKKYDSQNNLIETENKPQISTAFIISNGNENEYIACFLDDSYLKFSDKFRNTAVDGIYLYEKYFVQSNSKAKANAYLTSNSIIEYSFEFPQAVLKLLQGNKYNGLQVSAQATLVRLYPTGSTSNINQVISGTGFALASQGYIVTNYHVVEDGKSIKVKGINGEFSKSYSARVVVSDKNNDLAIIKIDDANFISLGAIPYKIKSSTSAVATEIYTLGYPLKASMGDEIKYTSGEISSLSGYEGGITLYQHTAPIQPGSSGGPMFDKNGSVIGIVNAKLMGAENASYAIKSKYLLSLVEEAPETITLPDNDLILGKSVSEQVSICKNFVYLIEVE